MTLLTFFIYNQYRESIGDIKENVCAYYCQSYRYLTFLVFSDKPLEKKTLKKMANRNEVVEKIIIDGALMIRMNEQKKKI